MKKHLIENISQISNQWLNNVLSSRDTDIKYSFIEPIALNGQTSQVYRIYLEYSSNEMPTSLILKLPPESKNLKKLSTKLNRYINEVNFYKKFGTDAGIDIPKCYFCDIDNQTGTYNIFLQDLLNYEKMYPSEDSLKYVEKAIHRLAKFHAKWWQKEELKNSWLHDGRQADNLSWYFTILNSFINIFKEEYWQYISDHSWEISSKIINNWEEYLKNIRIAHTLVHGDFHFHQILFNTENIQDLAVLDWQTCMIHWGGLDLARILITGLLPADRQKHEKKLIEDYYLILKENGINDVSLSQITDTVRFCGVFSLFTHIMTVGMSDIYQLKISLRKHNINFEEFFFTWPSIAIEDWDSYEAMRSLSESLNKI